MASDKVKDVRLKLSAGTTPDGFSEDVQVEDTNNAVFLPDGSAMAPREGSEIRRRDEIGFGSDRKVIYFIADPPDIDYGDMIALVNTKDGRNDVQATEVVRTTVTRSEQNPLPMPDLPDMPEPTKNAVLLYNLDEDSGSNIYGLVAVWDDANQQVVGPVTLNNSAYGYTYYYAMRSTSYFVTYSWEPTPGMHLKVWDIDAMVSDAGSNQDPIRTITVFTEDVIGDTSVCVWMYKGDIAYVAVDLDSSGSHDYRLFTVNLTNGDVSDKAITGFTGTLRTSGRGSMAVDADGYLWGTVYDSGVIPYKINPSTGACQMGSAFAGPSGFDQGLVLLSDGSMLLHGTNDSTWIIASDLTASEVSYSPLQASLATWEVGAENCSVSDKAIAQDGNGARPASLTDGTLGTHLTSNNNNFWAPASLYHDGTKFAVAGWDYDAGTDTYASDLFLVNVSDGTVASRVSLGGLDTQGLPLETGYTSLSDVWGYGIENLQGVIS